MKFEIVKELANKSHNRDTIKLPRRATDASSGYDFYNNMNESIIIKPYISDNNGTINGTNDCTYFYTTDIKVVLPRSCYLMIAIRSSWGIKHNIMLKNVTGIIDADYYNNPKNDGNIILALYNYGDTVVEIKPGQGIAQGIIHKYFVTDDDDPISQVRKGGIGSTNADII
jgi:dUTP pyrophosphatase